MFKILRETSHRTRMGFSRTYLPTEFTTQEAAEQGIKDYINSFPFFNTSEHLNTFTVESI
jgi:hypothetical protein